MAMNREQRRYLQRQGQIDADGNPTAAPREQRAQPRAERVGPVAYMGEVRSELRRVSWPTRPEVIRYSIVVLITLILFTSYIAGLDYGFGELIIRLLRASR